MSVLMRRNVPVGADPLLAAPGRPARLEMVWDGGRRRAWADTPADLLEVLVPGYAGSSDSEKVRRRLEHALVAQVAVQSRLVAADLVALGECDAWERAFLLGPRHDPPAPDVWMCQIPLVLVDAFYRPFSPERLAPLTADGDVREPAGIVWLRPTDEWDYLLSLAAAGFVALGQSLHTRGGM